MSITYSTYVGPYVRCAVGAMDAVEQISACANPACPNHQRHLGGVAFCHLCGSRIGDAGRPIIRDAVDSWAVREEISDRLTTATGDGYMEWGRENHAHIWIPNVTVPWRDCRLEEHADFALVEITAEQVLEERAAFSVFFQAELAILRQHYGAAHVSLHWGIVQDYN